MKKTFLFCLFFCFIFSGQVFSQVPGDVNNDSQVDIVDALLAAQYYVGLNPPGFDPDAADVNCDSAIDIVDALLIAQYYVGLISTFPCQTTHTYFGDTGAIEPSLANDPDIIWFAGYEKQPDWEDSWGIEWGPDPAEHHSITGANVLFGSYAARVTYAAGISSSQSGVQYMCRFTEYVPPVDGQESLYCRYYVRFDPDFTFVKGGKLPGFIGGEANTGGNKPTGFDGFSTRLMWRGSGKVVQYVYHIDQPTEYGEDLDWDIGGQRYFTPGKWHCVETYLRMNSVSGQEGNGDGIVRSWFDGELALERTNLRFRHTQDIKIDGFYFSTFFGGSGDEWAPATDQYAQFDNFLISKNYIGPCTDCVIPPAPTPTPTPNYTVVNELLIFDSDNPGWKTGAWSKPDSTYDFDSPDQNHTRGGAESAYIHHSPSEWDAASFTMDSGSINARQYTHISLWLYPLEPDPEFRLCFRLDGAYVGNEIVINSSPVHFPEGMQLNEWNRILFPIEEFDLTQDVNQVLIKTDSVAYHPPFYVDDVQLLELVY